MTYEENETGISQTCDDAKVGVFQVRWDADSVLQWKNILVASSQTDLATVLGLETQ